MTKAESRRRTVYPVEGQYLNDVPAVAHLCDDPNCVESGAFTTTKPPGAAEPADTEGPASAEPSTESEA